MSNAKKAFLAVSSGMLALGLILMACGFVLSGFSLDVFTATVDPTRDRVVLGGVEVDDYDELPLLNQIAEIGQIGIGRRTTSTSTTWRAMPTPRPLPRPRRQLLLKSLKPRPRPKWDNDTRSQSPTAGGTIAPGLKVSRT